MSNVSQHQNVFSMLLNAHVLGDSSEAILNFAMGILQGYFKHDSHWQVLLKIQLHFHLTRDKNSEPECKLGRANGLGLNLQPLAHSQGAGRSSTISERRMGWVDE